MNYDDYITKRCQLFNQREKGFQIIQNADAEIQQLDKLYESSQRVELNRGSVTSLIRNIAR